MSKKILMISSTWDTDYINTILQGVIRRLESEDVKLYVFNAYDDALESEYHMMERAIYSLPDAKQYDGVLLAVNSVGNQSAANELAAYYHNLGIPVLSMELQLENAAFIGTDNYQAMYDMVEHMVTVHGCRTFNYIGGPEEHIENQARYRAFCECLRKYGVDVEANRILHLSFQGIDGTRAYSIFKDRGLHLPDAVICANDPMALGYCDAASLDGYLAPDDFRITGFDHIKDARNYAPAIASVERNWEQLGYDGMAYMLDMIAGKADPACFTGQRLVFNESCGCTPIRRNYREEMREVYRQKRRENRMQVFERRIRNLFAQSIMLEELKDKLKVCQEMTATGKMAICLNETVFASSADVKTEYDTGFLVYTSEYTTRVRRDERLVPENWCNDEKVFFFSPLHFSRVNFGYCVIAVTRMWNPDVGHKNLMDSISLGLEGIRQHSNLQRANKRLEELYVQDPMTGMYNRFGYEATAGAFFNEQGGKVYAMYLDLDNLKVFNDQHGHEMGDRAIMGLSSVLKAVFDQETIRVRMGGDEFLVIGRSEGEENLLQKVKNLHLYMEEYSRMEDFPETVRVSEGHVDNADGKLSLEQMIRIADQNMYAEKQKKKYDAFFRENL